MNVHDHPSSQGDSHRESARGSNSLVGIFKTFVGPKEPVYVDGYMKKGQSDGFVMFSESPRAATWSEISVRSVRGLEYFGREFIPDGVCAKVRLTL